MLEVGGSDCPYLTQMRTQEPERACKKQRLDMLLQGWICRTTARIHRTWGNTKNVQGGCVSIINQSEDVDCYTEIFAVLKQAYLGGLWFSYSGQNNFSYQQAQDRNDKISCLV